MFDFGLSVLIPSFELAMLSSFLLGGLLKWAGSRFGWLPAIRGRDVHTVRTPRLGGIAMWFSIILTSIWLLIIGPEGLLQFGSETILGIDKPLAAVGAALLVILGFGLYDDYRGLHWSGQLVGQILASLFLVAGGVVIQRLNTPFGQLIFAPFWSAFFTVVWTMLLINVMNWFDGLDGLAGSVAVVAATILCLLSLQLGIINTALASIVLIGAVVGFLFWNWHPADLFMGTVGSQTLGLLLAVIAIISGGKVATATLVLGIPLFDALVVIVRRLLAGTSPFEADNRHLHHRLLSLGIPIPWVVLLISGFSAIFGLMALYFPYTNIKAGLLLILVAIMLFIIYISYLLERKVEKRVD